MSRALVIVDVQTSLFFGNWAIPAADELLKRIGDRLIEARLQGEFVVHVQNDGPVDEPDAPGEIWWDLVLTQRAGELVVRKTHQNVFESNPDLANQLKELGITELEFVGVQSDMCLGASARAAHALGFKIIVQRQLHATYDGGYPGSDDPTTAEEISDRIQAELAALN